MVRKFLLFLALVGALTTVAPADATGYWAVRVRWGSASAAHDGRSAMVFLQHVRFAKQDPNQKPRRGPHVCIGFRDTNAGVSVDTCADNAFAMADTLRSAQTRGTAHGVVRRLSDHAKVGTTTLRFDMTWRNMSLPGPMAQVMAQACPNAPWAPGWVVWSANPILNVMSRGSARGVVTADGLGSVRFSEETLTWWTALGDSTGTAVFGGRANSAITAQPRCARLSPPAVGA